MQYRILSTLTVLGAPGADPSTPINQRAHSMLRKQKGDPALSEAVGPWGAGAANRLALRTRGGAEVTWKVQQVKMQRCFLAHCLRAACTLTLHCTHALRLPTTPELQPFPGRRCRTQVLTMPCPPPVHSYSGHLPKKGKHRKDC